MCRRRSRDGGDGGGVPKSTCYEITDPAERQILSVKSSNQVAGAHLNCHLGVPAAAAETHNSHRNRPDQSRLDLPAGPQLSPSIEPYPPGSPTLPLAKTRHSQLGS